MEYKWSMSKRQLIKIKIHLVKNNDEIDKIYKIYKIKEELHMLHACTLRHKYT